MANTTENLTNNTGCGICDGNLRAGEGYTCLNCISDTAKRLCRVCYKGVISATTVCRCPFCRGDSAQVVALGQEGKYAKEVLGEVNTCLNELNAEVKAIYIKYKLKFDELYPYLKENKKVFNYGWVKDEGGVYNGHIPIMTIKDDTIPKTTETPPIRYPIAILGAENNGVRGDNLAPMNRCRVKKPRGGTQCSYRALWDYSRGIKVCVKHKNAIEREGGYVHSNLLYMNL